MSFLKNLFFGKSEPVPTVEENITQENEQIVIIPSMSEIEIPLKHCKTELSKLYHQFEKEGQIEKNSLFCVTFIDKNTNESILKEIDPSWFWFKDKQFLSFLNLPQTIITLKYKPTNPLIITCL